MHSRIFKTLAFVALLIASLLNTPSEAKKKPKKFDYKLVIGDGPSYCVPDTSYRYAYIDYSSCKSTHHPHNIQQQ